MLEEGKIKISSIHNKQKMYEAWKYSGAQTGF
jgi:hypothetical protein